MISTRELIFLDFWVGKTVTFETRVHMILVEQKKQTSINRVAKATAVPIITELQLTDWEIIWGSAIKITKNIIRNNIKTVPIVSHVHIP